MDTDDLAPPQKKAKGYALGQELSKHSVADLTALIEELKAEMARVELALNAKQSSLNTAQSVFKR